MCKSISIIILNILIFLSLTISDIRAQSATFRVTTVTYSGKYKPAHVFALWITDSSGKYVRTINRQSKNYTSTLSTWMSNSGNKTLDGITGASLTSHNAALNKTGGVSRIPFVWDCKDYNGNLVADGTYYVNVEFSEEGASKNIKYAFTKGSANQDISYTNVTTSPGKYFQNATLSFTALVTGINETESSKKYDVFYSNSSRLLQINFDAPFHNNVSMTVYNQAGKLIYKKNQLDASFSVGLNKISAGIYFVKLTDETGKSQTNKIIVK